MRNTVSESAKQSTRKGKNLVVCCDGTGNRGGATPDTNVYRVFCGIDREKVDDLPQQLTYYDDGVGTERNKYFKAIGAAAGCGFTANVEDAYRFLCRNWEDGDRIYLFGFSRGAYTVRALAALIISAGIISGRNLKRAELDQAIKKLRRAYSNFQKARRAQENRRTRSERRSAAQTAAASSSSDETTDTEANLEFGGFWRSGVELRGATVQVIGVWDTVSALGLPFDVGLKRIIERLINRYRFVDHYLSDKVCLGRQALSLDDQRHTFHPEVWNQWKLLSREQVLQAVQRQHEEQAGQEMQPDPTGQEMQPDPTGQEMQPDPAGQPQEPAVVDSSLVQRANEQGAQYVPCTNVDQVWFAGVHSNVGGGYPKWGMDYVTLQWMIRDLNEKHQLRFRSDFIDEVNRRANVHGRIYDSRSGVASYYRYRPRQLREAHGFHRLRRRSKHEPNIRVDATKATRQPYVNIHESVFERIDARTDGYDVGNLPADVPVTVVGSVPQVVQSQPAAQSQRLWQQEKRLQQLQRRLEQSRGARLRVQRSAEAWFHRREGLHLAFVMMNLFPVLALMHIGLNPCDEGIPVGPLQGGFSQVAGAGTWLLHYWLPLVFVGVLGWVAWELRAQRGLWCIPLAASLTTVCAVVLPVARITTCGYLPASIRWTMEFLLPDIVANALREVIVHHPTLSLVWVLGFGLLLVVRCSFREKSETCFENLNQEFRATLGRLTPPARRPWLRSQA